MRQKEKINKINVPIFGDEYTIKGDADTSHIEEVASYVDKKMKELAKKYPVLSPKQVAVLTAVNIADELISLQEDYNDLIKLLDSNTGS